MSSRFAAILLLGLAAAAPVFCDDGVDAEIAATVNLFYNLEFDKALAAMDALDARHPGHPAASFYRSIIHYQKYITEIPKSTTTLKAFELENEKAIERAEAWISTDAATAEFYLGAAYGYSARVLSAQRHFFKAIPKAKKGVKHLKKAVDLNPDRYDSYLGLGMYNYFASRMPKAAKPFAFLLGVKGNRELGLEQMELVAARGTAAKMEARSVLASIYASDKEGAWDKADALIAEQMSLYPGNPSDRLRRIYANQRMGRWAEAASYADPEGKWIEKIPDYLKENVKALSYYRAVESLLFSSDTVRTGKYLDVLEKIPASEEIKTWTVLRRANWLDLNGQREEAIKTYRSLKGEDVPAKVYIKHHFPYGKPVLMPFDDGLGLD